MYKKTFNEIWPVAVDEYGFWLLGEDAWRPAEPVTADVATWDDVLLHLAGRGITPESGLIEIHQTSSRDEGPFQINAWYASIDCPGPLIEHWPDARPITVNLARHVGRAPSHGPLTAPTPRYIDVLKHALRHLAFRLSCDADAIATYSPYPLWAEQLADLEPALAGMYGVESEAA